MGFFLVLKAEWVRAFVIMRRYWFATLTSIIIGYGMLLMLIIGFMYKRDSVQSWAEGAFGDNATESALGFIIGMFAFSIIGLFSQGLQGMARSGELEQVCMSPHGLVTNFFARSFVAAVSNILSSSVILWLIKVTFKGQLTPSLGPTVTLLALTYVNLIGFGFMMGGLVLVFKQVGQIMLLVRLVFVILPMAVSRSIENLWGPVWLLAHLFPITDAAICLKLVLLEGIGWRVTTEPSFWWLLGNCTVWTTAGVLCFRMLENWSRDKGTLGAY